MALKEHDTHNFQTLLMAVDNEQIALIESRLDETGEYVAMVCAMQVNDDESITPVPLAVMIQGNPFELYADPELPEAKEPPFDWYREEYGSLSEWLSRKHPTIYADYKMGR